MKFDKFCLCFLLLFCFALDAFANELPVRNDSRIKTLVFNENEVYSIITRTGFQTSVELDRKEKVETISIGDAVGWQITPSKNRIFIKPLLRNTTTNLSVITSKRSYQFELVSDSSESKTSTHAYVVKFFYPELDQFVYASEDRSRGSLRPVSPTAIPAIPTIPTIPQPLGAPVAPAIAKPVFPAPAAQLPPRPQVAPSAAPITAGLPALSTIGIAASNFNYTLSGPEAYAPKKIFDDGRNTYFEFDPSQQFSPQFFAVNAAGQETPVQSSLAAGKFAVPAIAPQFIVRNSFVEDVVVFNESFVGR